MASRRFFSYDPYDYYYTLPYHYTYPYYQYQHPAPSRGVGGFFPAAAADAAPEAVKVDPRPRVESSRSVSIPVRFVGSNPEPARGATRMPQPAAAAVQRKRAPSAEAAAVRLQAAARGFMARKSVRAVREVEREAAEVAEKVARDADALRGDARARIAVEEALMKLLLRLDAVRGAREYRRSVTKRVLALQDAVDALEPKAAAPESEAVAEENESEMADDGAAVTELPPLDAEHSAKIEVKAPDETGADMEVDGDRADSAPAAEAVEGSGKLQDGGNIDDGGKPEGSEDAEGEWEMVAEEAEPARAPAASTEAPQEEPMTSEMVRTTTGEAGAADGALDTRKIMEMVAALWNAQQCAVIGALAERVDALERAVRRVEDAERRRRRGKKLRKQGKGSNNSRCYSSD